MVYKQQVWPLALKMPMIWASCILRAPHLQGAQRRAGGLLRPPVNALRCQVLLPLPQHPLLLVAVDVAEQVPDVRHLCVPTTAQSAATAPLMLWHILAPRPRGPNRKLDGRRWTNACASGIGAGASQQRSVGFAQQVAGSAPGSCTATSGRMGASAVGSPKGGGRKRVSISGAVSDPAISRSSLSFSHRRRRSRPTREAACRGRRRQPRTLVASSAARSARPYGASGWGWGPAGMSPDMELTSSSRTSASLGKEVLTLTCPG